MPISFKPNWNRPDSNNVGGKSQDDIVKILASAEELGEGDVGFRKALATNSSQVAIVKGIHQEKPDGWPHITVDYLGGRWHVEIVQTNTGHRVGKVSQ